MSRLLFSKEDWAALAVRRVAMELLEARDRRAPMEQGAQSVRSRGSIQLMDLIFGLEQRAAQASSEVMAAADPAAGAAAEATKGP